MSKINLPVTMKREAEKPVKNGLYPLLRFALKARNATDTSNAAMVTQSIMVSLIKKPSPTELASPA